MKDFAQSLNISHFVISDYHLLLSQTMHTTLASSNNNNTRNTTLEYYEHSISTRVVLE